MLNDQVQEVLTLAKLVMKGGALKESHRLEWDLLIFSYEKDIDNYFKLFLNL